MARTGVVEMEKACNAAIEASHKKFSFGDAFYEGLAGVKSEFGSVLVGDDFNSVNVVRQRGTYNQLTRLDSSGGLSFSSGNSFVFNGHEHPHPDVGRSRVPLRKRWVMRVIPTILKACPLFELGTAFVGSRGSRFTTYWN